MSLSPEKNFSNVFRVGKFTQIRYSVFMDPLSRPLKILLAEWSLKQKSKNALVASHNKELWTFSLDDKENPIAPGSEFELKEISTGTFITSGLVILDDSPYPQAFPAPYIPLLRAFNNVVSRLLTVDYDYIPIGGVLLSPSNNLLKYNLRLLPSGLLLLVPRAQETPIKRITENNVPTPNSKIILAPNGIHCTFCEIETKVPKDATTIIHNIFLASGIRIFQEDKWCSLKLEGSGSICSWPSELCFFVQPMSVGNNEADLEWFRASDPLEDAEMFMQSYLKREAEPSNKVRDELVRQKRPNVSAIYPTPPDPSQSHQQRQNEATRADTTNWGVGPLAPKWNDDVGSNLRGTNDEEDPLMLDDTEEVTEADFNFFDDPHSQNDFFGSDSLSQPMQLDENKQEELTHEETNFMDVSMILKENAKQNINTAEEFNNQPQQTQILEQQQEESRPEPVDRIITPPLSPMKVTAEELDSSIVPQKRKSAFAPLSFYPNIERGLDNKYGIGGRFYVPDDQYSDSDSDSDDFEHFQDISKDSKTIYTDKYDDSRGDTKQPTEDISSENYVTRQIWWPLLSTSSNFKDDYLFSVTAPCSSSLTKAFQRQSSEAAKTDIEGALQVMCEAIVWDNGILESFLPRLPTQTVCGSDFVNVLRSIFDAIQPLSLRDYALISDSEARSDHSASILNTETVTAPNTTKNAAAIDASSVPMTISISVKTVFPIPPPQLSLMRMNSVLEIQPPSVRFWHIFGFSPLNGPKDISSFMVFPNSQGMVSAVSSFMDKMKPVYEGSNLGSFRFGEAGEFKNGMVPVNSNAMSDQDALDDLRSTCVRLGDALAMESNSHSRNILIFIVAQFSDPASLLHISESIYQLKKQYSSYMTQSSTSSNCNLVFQILTASFFASQSTLVVPSQYDMVKLGLLIYSKCLSVDDKFNRANIHQSHVPAFTVARSRPPSISFQVTNTPSPALFLENSCIHVAYARSRDKRFVTVAWSDQYGELGNVRCFLLTKEGSLPRSVEDVYAEIWERTMEIIPRLAIQWRLVITKVGSMDQDEIYAWLNLASLAPGNVSVMIFCADINPSLSVLETADQILASQYSNIYSTPETTPQRPTDSPLDLYGRSSSTTPGMILDHGTPMSNATPTSSSGLGLASSTGGANNSSISVGANIGDQDTMLIDLKDDAYGVLIRHKLPIDETDTAERFSIASGYIVKPGCDNGRMSVFQVSLLHGRQPWESLMEDILRQFRSLASYGAYSGITDNRNNTLPWHIVAVDKMQRLLEFLL
ncbi:mediator complex subunit 13 C-terminal-domain-containing protein [Dipodascopsis uninucleata]